MQNSSDLSENISTSFFNYSIILFVCLPFYLWKLPQKSSKFNIFTWISIIISEMLYKNFSFNRKCLHFLLHLYSNCVCIPFIDSEIFFKKNFNFINFAVIMNLIIHKLDVNLQNERIYLHFLFQGDCNCICMPTIVSEFFSE